MTKWTFSNAEEYGNYVGIIEFQSIDGEWHDFEIFETPKRIVFGGATNTGFMESGYMVRDRDFSLDENLQTLVEGLQNYYNFGPEEATELICTERM